MKTVTQKQTALKSWIRSVTGYDDAHVILRNSGGPKPAGNYAVFDSPSTVQNVGTAFKFSESVTDGVITRVFVQNTLVRVGVDLYGQDSADIFDKFELAALAYAPRSILSAADLVFVRRSGVIYVPESGNTGPRDRWRADFYFYTQVDYTEVDYELQRVDATIGVIDPNDNETTGSITAGEVEETEE